MDIDLLAKLIKETALEHEEISLPDVGTFVAELSPAVFSDKGYSMSPPYRKLSFRQRPGNDTLLVEAYSKSAGITLEEAASDLNEFLKGLKEILAIKKTIILPGLGKMRATRENVFFFVPDADLDIYPDGFGLGPISLRTHSAEVVEIPVTEQSNPASQQNIPASKQNHSATKQDCSAAQQTTDIPEETASETRNSAADEPAKSSAFKVIIVLLCIIVVLAIAVAVLGRVTPELIDRILYSPEDYKLLHG